VQSILPRIQTSLSDCVAGCDGSQAGDPAAPGGGPHRTVCADCNQGGESLWTSKPGAPLGKTAAEANDVVCVAGCINRPGQVLQRMSGLPPPPKVVPEARNEALPKAPTDKKNEPLEVRH
jgi:hypothetical protein